MSLEKPGQHGLIQNLVLVILYLHSPKVTLPDVGSTKPDMSITSVLLPEPVDPTKATDSPSIFSEKSSKTICLTCPSFSAGYEKPTLSKTTSTGFSTSPSLGY